MMVDPVWDNVTPEQWITLAQGWFAEGRGPEGAPRPCSDQVVLMNFTASSDAQWEFIQTAIACTTTDDDLGHLAAGPIEHLLGWHGPAVIDLMGREAACHPSFARALTGVRRYLMKEPVWARIQVLQRRVPDPLTDG